MLMLIGKFCLYIPSLFGVFFFLKTKKKANADPRTTTNATDATIGTTTFVLLEPPFLEFFTHNPSGQIRSEFPSRLLVTSVV